MLTLQPTMTAERINDELGNVQPGDEIVFRPGTYYHPITFPAGGNSTETAVNVYFDDAIIDGDYQFPFGQADGRLYHPSAHPVHHAPLVGVDASFINLYGLEAARSSGRGLRVGLTEEKRINTVTVAHAKIYDCRHRGVGFQRVDYGVFRDSEVFGCANFAPFPRSADNDPEDHSGVNWPTIVAALWSTNISFHNNLVHESWGELIVAGLDCSYIYITENICYDGFLGVYANRCQYIDIVGNLVYHTGNRDFYRGSRNASPGNGIECQNEQHRDGAVAKGVTVEDNVVAGWGRGLVSGGGQGTGDAPEDLSYSYNTIIECVRHDDKGSAIQLLPPESTTTVFYNIIQHSKDKAIAGGRGKGYEIGENLINQTNLPTVQELLAAGESVTADKFASPMEGFGATLGGSLGPNEPIYTIPGEPVEEPEPEPEPEPPSGLPREQYRREYWAFDANLLTPEVIESIYLAAARALVTVGPSRDDAGIGALADKTAVLIGLPEEQHAEHVAWYEEWYPGTTVEFRTVDEILSVLSEEEADAI